MIRRHPNVVLFFGVLAVALIGFYGSSVIQQHSLRASIRRDHELLSCYIQAQISRSQATIPTLAYYQQHPAELKKALLDIDKQRAKTIALWGACPE